MKASIESKEMSEREREGGRGRRDGKKGIVEKG